MKRLGPTSNRRAGLLLVECVVYLAVFILLASLALAAFYAGWDHHHHLARNARLILNTTQAGERWREDVRQASGLIEVEPGGARLALGAGGAGEVVYRFDGERVLRVSNGGAPIVVLEEVRSSRVSRVDGQHARAWRWEVELARPQRAARVAPLFVFTAVSRGP